MTIIHSLFHRMITFTQNDDSLKEDITDVKWKDVFVKSCVLCYSFGEFIYFSSQEAWPKELRKNLDWLMRLLQGKESKWNSN